HGPPSRSAAGGRAGAARARGDLDRLLAARARPRAARPARRRSRPRRAGRGRARGGRRPARCDEARGGAARGDRPVAPAVKERLLDAATRLYGAAWEARRRGYALGWLKR